MNATTTLLITPFCPLNCRYCNLAEDMNEQRKKENPEMSFEQMQKTVELFLDKYKMAETWTITMTGGEPFLRWNDIKKLITLYPQVTWDFNTSGYLLNDEILEWLSHYKIRWNLSVDGGEKVTNYLRPLRNGSLTAPSYFQKLKEIVPALTYFFPEVYCKVIISKRLVKELYKSWLELEQIGFKKMFLILDFTEREDTKRDSSQWTDEDFQMLQEQLNKIAEQLYIGMRHGFSRLEIIQFNEILNSLLNPHEIGPKHLICEVLDDRSLSAIFEDKPEAHLTTCYSSLKLTKEEFENVLNESFKDTQGKCPNDPSCPFFNHCALRTCVKDNIEIRHNAWAPEWSFCHLMKLCGNSAIYFLDLCNKHCPESKLYHFYLNERMGGM